MWASAAAERLRARRKEARSRSGGRRPCGLARVRAGAAHAALVFDGDDCVGWCQFGVPGEVPKIKNRAQYEKGLTGLPDWRIACCFVGKGHRRRGVAAAALAGALDLIAGLGGGTVEGYPEDANSVPAGFLFNGALSTYEALGFSRDRKIGKRKSSKPGRKSALAHYAMSDDFVGTVPSKHRRWARRSNVWPHRNQRKRE